MSVSQKQTYKPLVHRVGKPFDKEMKMGLTGWNIIMAEAKERKKSGPDKVSIYWLYIFSLSPFVLCPFFYFTADYLDQIYILNSVFEFARELFKWASFYFSSNIEAEFGVSELVYYIHKFTRLTAIITILVLLLGKILLRSKRFDIQFPFLLNMKDKFSDEAYLKKKLEVSEWCFLIGFCFFLICFTDLIISYLSINIFNHVWMALAVNLGAVWPIHVSISTYRLTGQEQSKDGT